MVSSISRGLEGMNGLVGSFAGLKLSRYSALVGILVRLAAAAIVTGAYNGGVHAAVGSVILFRCCLYPMRTQDAVGGLGLRVVGS